jgi:hypothetical protein
MLKGICMKLLMVTLFLVTFTGISAMDKFFAEICNMQYKIEPEYKDKCENYTWISDHSTAMTVLCCSRDTTNGNFSGYKRMYTLKHEFNGGLQGDPLLQPVYQKCVKLTPEEAEKGFYILLSLSSDVKPAKKS